MRTVSSVRKEGIVKLLVLLILPGMVFVMALTLGAGAYLFPLSQEVARANPNVAFMRLPVLLIAQGLLLLFLLACGLSLPLLIRVLRARIYARSAVRLLRGMGLCFITMIPLFLGLILYTRAHVSGSITNLYCLLGAGLALVAGCILFLFAQVLAQGAHYKQEVDLTV
ncbi:MAG: DUF2975 domain-containing protein [Christensenellales bacterium]